MIKKLLINSNRIINKKTCKKFKKYSFCISNVLFIISVNNYNSKIIEIYEEKGNNKKKIILEKKITKKLIHIKNYLEKKIKKNNNIID